MRDFTLKTLRLLLSSLSEQGYTFLTFSEYLSNPGKGNIILRHDVDARPGNSLKCAELENRMGIKGTYYFRTVAESYNEKAIKEINSLGHEIGYHYEELTLARGEYETAIRLFQQNLAKLRRLVPVETICMHGSPLSKYDNRLLWEKYNYSDYGIIGEPYLDVDFQEVMYLTDTGRRWDGEMYNIRDKINFGRNQPANSIGNRSPFTTVCHSTFDIIRAAQEKHLPPAIMITIHPQRWDNSFLPWMQELVWQNIKNIVKGSVAVFSR